MEERASERPPTWATVLLGWIAGAGFVEWRGAEWSAPPAPPVCSLEPPGPTPAQGPLRPPGPPGPRELRQIAGVGRVRAVAVARHLLEHPASGAGAAGPTTLAELTGIPGVGPVIGQRLHAHLARREFQHWPPGAHRRRSRPSD